MALKDLSWTLLKDKFYDLGINPSEVSFYIPSQDSVIVLSEKTIKNDTLLNSSNPMDSNNSRPYAKTFYLLNISEKNDGIQIKTDSQFPDITLNEAYENYFKDYIRKKYPDSEKIRFFEYFSLENPPY